MDSKKFLKHGKNIGIEPRRFSQRFGARVCLESGIANGQRKRSRGQAGFAEALAGFLRKMAEHRGQGLGLTSVFAESVIVRNRFRLGVDHKFVRVAATRLAIERGAPLAENLFT